MENQTPGSQADCPLLGAKCDLLKEHLKGGFSLDPTLSFPVESDDDTTCCIVCKTDDDIHL
jgi:hypothetical protein